MKTNETRAALADVIPSGEATTEYKIIARIRAIEALRRSGGATYQGLIEHYTDGKNDRLRHQSGEKPWISIDWGRTHHSSITGHQGLQIDGLESVFTYASYLVRGIGELRASAGNRRYDVGDCR
jgi:hypothetical protein